MDNNGEIEIGIEFESDDVMYVSSENTDPDPEPETTEFLFIEELV